MTIWRLVARRLRCVLTGGHRLGLIRPCPAQGTAWAGWWMADCSTCDVTAFGYRDWIGYYWTERAFGDAEGCGECGAVPCKPGCPGEAVNLPGGAPT